MFRSTDSRLPKPEMHRACHSFSLPVSPKKLSVIRIPSRAERKRGDREGRLRLAPEFRDEMGQSIAKKGGREKGVEEAEGQEQLFFFCRSEFPVNVKRLRGDERATSCRIFSRKPLGVKIETRSGSLISVDERPFIYTPRSVPLPPFFLPSSAGGSSNG